MIRLRPFFGFRSTRFREWASLVKDEAHRRPLYRIAGHMLWLRLCNKRTAPHEWRRRIRVCFRCPIYDKSRHRCRPWDDSPLGCGCWAPLVALYETHCWATNNIPEENIGW